MALTRDNKVAVVIEVTNLLATSKMTVVANYQGTSVNKMQMIRKIGKENGTVIKVVKNRLFIKALKNIEQMTDSNVSELNQMLLYAFNNEDEIIPAKTILQAITLSPTIKFIGAYTPNGDFINADDVTQIANLPSKDQLKGMLVGTISAPLNSFVGVLNANLRSVINVLNARSIKLETE